jgi:hypothetical protein
MPLWQMTSSYPPTYDPAPKSARSAAEDRLLSDIRAVLVEFAWPWRCQTPPADAAGRTTLLAVLNARPEIAATGTGMTVQLDWPSSFCHSPWSLTHAARQKESHHRRSTE